MSAAPVELLLYTRDGCPLCDEFAAELAAFLGDRPGLLAIRVVDVDADPAVWLRWGVSVPVLVRGEHVVCGGHFDRDRLLACLADEGSA
ncbi:MAG: glutaredoxin family protein [Steroidobacteraceae bacterium]